MLTTDLVYFAFAAFDQCLVILIGRNEYNRSGFDLNFLEVPECMKTVILLTIKMEDRRVTEFVHLPIRNDVDVDAAMMKMGRLYVGVEGMRGMWWGLQMETPDVVDSISGTLPFLSVFPFLGVSRTEYQSEWTN